MKPKIKGIEFLSVVLSFEVPIDRSLYDLGSVRLECEDRTFILDVCNSYTNDDNYDIECDLEVDTETFPMGDETNYDLTAIDLMLNSDTRGTLYIGCEYEEAPTSITLFVRSGGKKGLTKAIDLDID